MGWREGEWEVKRECISVGQRGLVKHSFKSLLNYYYVCIGTVLGHV